MITRRKFVKGVGVGLLASGEVIAQERRGKFSPLSLLFSNVETAAAAFKPDPKSWDNSAITAAWIGHATVLINFFGTMILTDPVFSKRVGPSIIRLGTFGPKRLVDPALGIDELPPLDLILLSHAHFDHLDLPSLRRLSKNTPVVMAKNTSDLIDDMKWKSVQELDWGEKTTVGAIEVEGLRVNHFGWRYPWEKDRSRGNTAGRSYNGYLLSKNGRHIVFGGDTAYHEHFKAIGDRKINPDLAIMPIGAYDPWIFVHANPEQSAAMAGQMGAKAVLPVHWNTFTLSNEPVREPIERFKKAIGTHSPELALDEIGKTWSVR
jgi:L-ascorbate metabolism protein UlaG (beta-lactamase superfamily)